MAQFNDQPDAVPLEDNQSPAVDPAAALAAAPLEVQAEHDSVMGDMTAGDVPPMDIGAEIMAEHDAVLSDLSEAFTPPDMSPTADVNALPVANLSASPNATPQARYQVPAKDRTPGNRQQRREAVTRSRNGEAATADTFGGFLEAGGEVPPPDGAGPDADATMRAFVESTVKHADAVTQLLIDATRRLDAMTAALERERL